MKILITILCTPDFVDKANIVFKAFRDNISNPENHNLTFEVRSYLDYPPSSEFAFMNDWHPGTKISLWRFSLYKDCDYDRIISLDADMIIMQNIDLLLSEKLNDKPFYAVKDYGCPHYYKERIPPELVGTLFNGGLQIINKPLLYNDFLKDLIKGESFDGSDQGYLLYYFYKKGIQIGYLPDEYNYAFQDKFYPRVDNPILVHFTGTKPWNDLSNSHPYFVQWRKYAS